jgi:L,D-peptidoglycan transpeptidase YkuD (ErfK/YbiS/YcfS/YnhG family)
VRRFALFFFLCAISALAENSPIHGDCRQLVVVTTGGWTNVDGQLQCFERASDGKWKQHGKSIAVVVGHSGLGLTAGFIYPIPTFAPLPAKHEGDGRSPAGVLGLPTAFGYAPPREARWIKLPYIQCTDSVECVDDGKSSHYNQVFDARSVEKRDWNSSEQMHRKDELYRWGVVVDHNAGRQPGNGSCIFLHIWRGPHDGTTGCTAMEERDLKRLMGWLDPIAKPLLVQFPQTEYLQLQKLWQLPMIRP